jgi:PAS domain S-box-containing protein
MIQMIDRVEGDLELVALQEVCMAILSELDTREVFRLITEKARMLINAETVAIPVISEDRSTITYEEAAGKNRDLLKGMSLPMSEGGLCAWVVKHRKPILTNSLWSDNRINRELVKKLNVNEAIVVPLVFKGKIIGGLAAFGKAGGGGFTDKDLKLLTIFASHAAIAIRNSRLFKKMEELKRFNENIIQSMEEGVVIVDAEGFITFVNPVFERLTGYKRDEVVGKRADFVLPGLERHSQDRYEINFKKKSGKEVHLLVSASPLRGAGGTLYVLVDITDMKREQEKLMERMLSYDIKRGNLYLVKEKNYERSRSILRDMINCGFKGMVLSRLPVAEARRIFGEGVACYWLSEYGEGEDTIKPEPEVVETRIREFVTRTSVVLVDRFDYLITLWGFRSALALLQKLRDLAYLSRAVILISVDPATLDEREANLLEKETRAVGVKGEAELTEELYALLSFVHEQNLKGVKPSYKDVTRKLGVTRTTARKRVKILLGKGLLVEERAGRNKFLSVSEKGKRLIF